MPPAIADLRHALRTLRRSPGFTLAALLSLVIGIGLNATVFGITEAALLRPLPYTKPQTLYGIQHPNRVASIEFVSFPEYTSFRDQARSFEDVAAFRAGVAASRALHAESQSERVQGFAVSTNLFRVLKVQPVLGRTFLAADEQGGAQPPTVIGYGMWQRSFGGRRDVLGQTLRIDGQPHVIVGVMPEAFWFPFPESSFWTPLVPAATAGPAGSAEHSLSMVARLREGSSATSAAAEVSLLMGRLNAGRNAPDLYRRPVFVSLEDARRASDAPYFYLLQGVVACVLLIACVNVSNLLLIRALTRRRESAIRVALGASPWNVVRPVLGESVVLVVAATVLGSAIAHLAVRMIAAAISFTPLRDVLGSGINIRIAGFCVAIILATLALCTFPSLAEAYRTNVSGVLKEGGQSVGAAGPGQVLRSVFIVAQIALSLSLLFVAGLLIQENSHLSEWKPGFDTRGLFRMEARPLDREGGGSLAGRLISRTQAVPGVELAAAAARHAEPTISTGREEVECSCQLVTRDYLQTMGIPLVRGRHFTDADFGAGAVIIDAELARTLSLEGDPIGHQVKLGPARSKRPWATIVGVAHHVEMTRPSATYGASPPGMYILSRLDSAASMTLLVRSRPGVPLALPLRSAILEVDRDQPVYTLQTMESVLAKALGPLRWYAILLSAFAILALALAAVGLYGVIAYLVGQRTHEIGVRIALGAPAPHVFWMVMRGATRLILIGTGVGVLGGVAGGRLVASMVPDMKAPSPGMMVGVVLILAAVALAASIFPTLKALRIPPTEALRQS
ncbi:MAG TPA: ADOP family duplicated permease [Longimicrobium sp.]|nr:ADOP family duplicated permease [Longimicrobium sp.]